MRLLRPVVFIEVEWELIYSAGGLAMRLEGSISAA